MNGSFDMSSKSKVVGRPLTDSKSAEKSMLGGEDMNDIVQKISLEHISLEERRREAKKPLYLVRYE
jgi:hypothetical protein